MKPHHACKTCWSRRDFLFRSGGGVSGLALAYLLNQEQLLGDVIVRQGHPGPLMPSPFGFKRYGQSGIEISDLFPHVGSHADDIAFVRSVYGQSNDHVQATYEMQMGQTRMGFPSLGSWVTYGL